MADKSGIEWTEATWNPIAGCSIISPGCTNCYAMKTAARLEKMGGKTAEKYQGLTTQTKAGPVWNNTVRLDPNSLDKPRQWQRPRRIFVNSMSDLFHEKIPDAWIDQIFARMALTPHHTYQILTKRADRMREYLTAHTGAWDIGHAAGRIAEAIQTLRTDKSPVGPVPHLRPGVPWWPLSNVWLGVSVEDQTRANERIPDLLATPAAIRFVSAEPLLGPVQFSHMDVENTAPTGFYVINALTGRNSDMGRPCPDVPRLDWVICGGESGPAARPMHPDWARSLRDQCAAAGVAFFMKQMSGPVKSRMPAIPDDLMVRQTPHAKATPCG